MIFRRWLRIRPKEADHAERTGRVRDWVARIGGCRWPGGSSSGASTSRAWMDGATAWLTVDCRRAPAHSRESWVRTLEIGTYVGDPRPVQLQRLCVCPTGEHNSNACASRESGPTPAPRACTDPEPCELGTYVGDRYAHWRSVRMLEIHAPCNSNGCAFVQRVYITPTPARAGSRVACPEPGWSAH